MGKSITCFCFSSLHSNRINPTDSYESDSSRYDEYNECGKAS